MSSLDTLPTELTQDVFALACFDGGFTFPSLALVSRHFNELSLPMRFSTVSVFSIPQLEQFLRVLERHTRSHDSLPKSKVLGLFLSFPDVAECTDGPNRLQHALHALLDLVAPTLLTFVIHEGIHGAPCLGPFPAHLRFPVLEELSLSGIYKFPIRPDADPLDPSLPNLRRFHVVDISGSSCIRPMLHGLAAHAPRLTHLRVSNTRSDQGYDNVKWVLESAVKTLPLPHVRHTTVHIRMWAPPNDDNLPRDVLWVISGPPAPCSLAPTLKLLRASRPRDSWSDQLWDWWIESLSGRVGCWTERAEEDL